MSSVEDDQLVNRLQAVTRELDKKLDLLRQYELVMTQEDQQIVRDVQGLEAERDRLRALLRRVEFGAPNVGGCPFCGVYHAPHLPDCQLKAALEETR